MLEAGSAAAFIETYKKLLLAIAGPYSDDSTFLAHLIRARCLLIQAPERLDAAIDRLRAAGDVLDAEVIAAVSGMQVERWLYLRDTRSHSLFLHPDGSVAYGVHGLTERLRDVAGGSGVVIEAGLVVFRGRVVCDGLLKEQARFGPDLRRNYTQALAQARAAGRYASDRLFASDRASARSGQAVSG